MAEDKWTPDKELDDKDMEKEATDEARYRARRDYLVKKFSEPSEPKRKKRGWGRED